MLDHSEMFVYMTLKFLIQSHSLQHSSRSLETCEMARHHFMLDQLQRSQATFQVARSYLIAQPSHSVSLLHYCYFVYKRPLLSLKPSHSLRRLSFHYPKC